MVIAVNDESGMQTPPHEGDQNDVPQVPGGPPKPYDEMTPIEKQNEKVHIKEKEPDVPPPPVMP